MKNRMRTSYTTRRTHMSVWLFSLMLAVAGTTVSSRAEGQSPDAGPSRYAVASVRPNKHLEIDNGFQCTTDGFTATRVPLKLLIEIAYRVREYQLSGGPSWIESDGYDVRAKVDDSDLDAFKTGGRAVCAVMLQNLLADRFHLVVHHKTIQMPAYELVVAKGGPKLSLAVLGSDPNDVQAHAGVIDVKASTMSFLARMLSGNVGLPVTNKTNLSGPYAWALHWTPPGPHDVTSSGADLAADHGDDAGSIFSALQDQLGLQLKAINAPTDVIVVDHAERPTGN